PATRPATNASAQASSQPAVPPASRPQREPETQPISQAATRPATRPTTAPSTRPASQPAALSARYPPAVESGVTAPADACAWSFGREDVYEIDAFAYDGPDGLRVRSGPADLGIGHCAAGAAWALVLPRGEAELHSEAAREPEPLAHVWIRLHPSELD